MGSIDFVPRLVTDSLEQEPVASIASLRRVLSASETPQDTVERAALAGLISASVGWAFAGGYQAALARLDHETVPTGRLMALAASEDGGAHPKNIRTSLSRRGEGWALSGRKTFVTLGADVDVLFIVATTGPDAAGRSALRVVRLPSSRAGLSFETLPALPFAPEIGHAAMTVDAVVTDDEVLPGDGYDIILKPFRTIEDIHVMAAFVGWTIRTARLSQWDRVWIEEGVALLVLLRSIAASTELRPVTHFVLAGALASVRQFLDRAPWASADSATRENWERDRAILEVASSVREARREAAWRALMDGSQRDRGFTDDKQSPTRA